jgi:hypothetical protein
MRLLEKVALVAGIVLLGWLVYRVGPATLWTQIAEISWGFFIVLGLHGIGLLVNALGIRVTLPPERRDVPVPFLAGVLLTGDAVNAVMPTAVVGGQIVSIGVLSRRVPVEVAVSSVGQAAMAQFFAQALFVVGGAPLALATLPRGGLRSGLLVLSIAVALAVALVSYMAWSRDGLGRIRQLFEKMAWFRARWSAPRSRWRLFADEILGALRGRPWEFALVVGTSMLSWLLGVVEVSVILTLLRAPVSWRTALVIETLSVAIEGVLFFVPAKVGTQEGGKYLIFLVLGLDPVKGVAMGFVRRLQGLAWAVVGLSVLAILQTDRRQARAAQRN